MRLKVAKTKNGMVLIMVVWLISILAVFGIGLARFSWSAYHFAQWQINNFLAGPAMENVLLISKFDRMNDSTPAYDTLFEFTNAGKYDAGMLTVEYSIIDEERWININKTPSLILKDLPEMDMDKAVAVVNSEYKPYYPKEELMYVEEITETEYEGLKDFITIYGLGKINFNTCGEDVLAFLGLDQDLIEDIVFYRKGEDGDFGTEDDGIFTSTGSIVNTIMSNSSITSSEKTKLETLISKGMLGVSSDNYRIEAGVYFKTKKIAGYSVIFGPGKTLGTYAVKEWRE
ncbi:MAG: hypothetical protein ABH869_02200 [Candidatus Omnitrophota bacterium]